MSDFSAVGKKSDRGRKGFWEEVSPDLKPLGRQWPAKMENNSPSNFWLR